MRDVVALAELEHALHALDTQLRLQRAGPVVDTAMEYAAVVAGLVATHCRFLLHQGDAEIRPLSDEVETGRQADDAAADDDDVMVVGRHRSSIASPGAATSIMCNA